MPGPGVSLGLRYVWCCAKQKGALASENAFNWTIRQRSADGYRIVAVLLVGRVAMVCTDTLKLVRKWLNNMVLWEFSPSRQFKKQCQRKHEELAWQFSRQRMEAANCWPGGSRSGAFSGKCKRAACMRVVQAKNKIKVKASNLWLMPWSKSHEGCKERGCVSHPYKVTFVCGQ